MIISVEEMTAPAARMRSRPVLRFHSVRELTASEATWTRYPARRAARAVWATQMWLSIPQRMTVLRLPGRRLRVEQKTSLPKQEKICFSIGVTGLARAACPELAEGTSPADVSLRSE